MERDWLFKEDNFTCGIRAAGILIHDGKILLQRDRDGNEYALPGGHIRVGEISEKAVAREYFEETGALVEPVRLLFIGETFWEWKGRQSHSISFEYLLRMLTPPDLPFDGTFKPHKDNDKVVIGWVPLEKVKELIVYPEVLKDYLEALPEKPVHYISKDS